MTAIGSESCESTGRRAEWFVPKFGPEKFRVVTGLLFLPYTGMVLAFAAIGSMMAGTIHWYRVLAIVVIYFLGLGIAAHALDALGSKSVKPWGTFFSKGELWLLAIGSLVVAYSIAIYYMVLYVPWLCSMAIIEGFFVFAYNLEWFKGKFHTDGWFASGVSCPYWPVASFRSTPLICKLSFWREPWAFSALWKSKSFAPLQGAQTAFDSPRCGKQGLYG